MNSRRILVLLVFSFLVVQLVAQDNIPKTDGISGYLLTGPAIFNVKSNLLVTGPPRHLKQ